jgi:hypothetical protein
MYCPKCSSENQPEVKFCTRCGTNLAVLSEALNSKSTDKPWSDDPLVEMLKQYYNGKRSTAVGAGSILIGVTLLMILLRLNVPENLTGVLFNGLAACALIYGAIAVIAGIAGWVESSSKMKAINHPALQKPLPPASTVINVKSYNTDSINAPAELRDSLPAPASVTEQTTRHLEEERAKLPLPDNVSH